MVANLREIFGRSKSRKLTPGRWLRDFLVSGSGPGGRWFKSIRPTTPKSSDLGIAPLGPRKIPRIARHKWRGAPSWSGLRIRRRSVEYRCTGLICFSALAEEERALAARYVSITRIRQHRLHSRSVRDHQAIQNRSGRHMLSPAKLRTGILTGGTSMTFHPRILSSGG